MSVTTDHCDPKGRLCHDCLRAWLNRKPPRRAAVESARSAHFETAVAEAIRKNERIIRDAHKLARIKPTHDSLVWAATVQRLRLKLGQEVADAKKLAKGLRLGKKMHWQVPL